MKSSKWEPGYGRVVAFRSSTAAGARFRRCLLPPSRNHVPGWRVNLEAITAIQNQLQTTLTWTVAPLANVPSPVESFGIENRVVTTDLL